MKNKNSLRKLFHEFPDKEYTGGVINKLLPKIDLTGSVDHIQGSVLPKLSKSKKKNVAGNKVILSQEDETGIHQTLQEISQVPRISKSMGPFKTK